ncbi:hypothetical protein JD969_15240 [Planctomycetota bacterium]|nr:hypothetical protein JD969_15240 [Planctomycetota bacterium]
MPTKKIIIAPIQLITRIHASSTVIFGCDLSCHFTSISEGVDHINSMRRPKTQITLTPMAHKYQVLIGLMPLSGRLFM